MKVTGTTHYALVYVLKLNKATAKLERSEDPVDFIRVDNGICCALDYARRKHDLGPTERAILEPIDAVKRRRLEDLMRSRSLSFDVAWRQISGR